MAVLDTVLWFGVVAAAVFAGVMGFLTSDWIAVGLSAVVLGYVLLRDSY